MNWNKAHKAAKAKVMPTQVNPTKVTFYDTHAFAKACAAIEAAYPDAVASEDAVIAAGVGRDGAPIKMAVYIRKANKAEGQKSANVTLYNSGKAVWTNLEPVPLAE